MINRIRIAATAALIPVAFLAACGGGSSSDVGSGQSPAGAVAGVKASLSPAPLLPLAMIPTGANTFECRNVRIGAVETDTVSVPAGAMCVLDGTGLAGSLLVSTGAVVDARNVRVSGNVQADSAASVTVAGDSMVTGSVQIKLGGAANLLNVRVGGDLQLFANRGALLAQDNRVTGNVQVDDNTGGVTLIGNVANGNLQCKQNLPAPDGSGNTAALKEDQCITL
jgi:hypothetical protein